MKGLFFVILDVVSIFGGCSPKPHGVAISEEPISYTQGTQVNVNKQKPFNSKHVALNADYVKSVKQFASSFYMNAGFEESNVFSPLNIATCISMLNEGAAGQTKAEIDNALFYSNYNFTPKEEIAKMIKNTAINTNDTFLDHNQSCWVNERMVQGLPEDYVNVLTEYYYADMIKESFANPAVAAEDIANWINKKTNDFLDVTPEELEGLLSPSTYLALVTTIYLKAKWEKGFDVEKNTTGKFAGSNGDTYVTYMNQVQEKGFLYSGPNYTIGSIKYTDNLRLNILLPNKGTDYKAVLNDKNNIDTLLNVNATLVYSDENVRDIQYTIPKFEVRNTFDMVPIMHKMGINTVFGAGADLSGLGGGYVSDAQHGAGIKVDNEGVEAAAYTIIVVSKGSLSNPEFIVDHPFAYSITNQDGLPLFMGTIYDIEQQ